MTSPLSPQLAAFGATYTPAKVESGQEYWRLVKADGPDFSTGNVVVFVDVLDANGLRVVGVPVQFSWADGEDIQRTEAKPGDTRQGVSFVLSASGHSYGVRVADGKPSDSIFGMGLSAFEIHASFLLIFQRQIADGAPPPPEPVLTAREHIDEAIRHLQIARELLP